MLIIVFIRHLNIDSFEHQVLVLSISSLISVVYALLGFAINGINNVNIVMYERRFGLSSRQTGLVASFYDVTAGCTVSRHIRLSLVDN